LIQIGLVDSQLIPCTLPDTHPEVTSKDSWNNFLLALGSRSIDIMDFVEVKSGLAPLLVTMIEAIDYGDNELTVLAIPERVNISNVKLPCLLFK
jgi:hypothetical protein